MSKSGPAFPELFAFNAPAGTKAAIEAAARFDLRHSAQQMGQRRPT